MKSQVKFVCLFISHRPLPPRDSRRLRRNRVIPVLRSLSNVIPGLFACGTDSMGVLFNEKKAYTNYGGCAQGYAFVSGRDAGYFAAKQILAA